MRLLDAGCGIGRWTKKLVKEFPNAEIIALDHKRRLPRIKGVRFVEGTIEKLPFKDDEFDLIIASRVLPYVDMKTAIRELERVCNPKGIIIYELMQMGYYLQKLFHGELKRIVNFINLWSYINFEKKFLKRYDNIDAWVHVRYFSDFCIIHRTSLKRWFIFPIYSLMFTSPKRKPYKKEISIIRKIAKEILDEET